jgi:hypothetical protein
MAARLFGGRPWVLLFVVGAGCANVPRDEPPITEASDAEDPSPLALTMYGCFSTVFEVPISATQVDSIHPFWPAGFDSDIGAFFVELHVVQCAFLNGPGNETLAPEDSQFILEMVPVQPYGDVSPPLADRDLLLTRAILPEGGAVDGLAAAMLRTMGVDPDYASWTLSGNQFEPAAGYVPGQVQVTLESGASWFQALVPTGAWPAGAPTENIYSVDEDGSVRLHQLVQVQQQIGISDPGPGALRSEGFLSWEPMAAPFGQLEAYYASGIMWQVVSAGNWTAP